MMLKRSIIDIWQGFKYGSAASFFNICPLSSIEYLNEYMNILFFSESVQLPCSRDVYQKIYKIFYWFPNHLLCIEIPWNYQIFIYSYDKAHLEKLQDGMQG